MPFLNSLFSKFGSNFCMTSTMSEQKTTKFVFYQTNFWFKNWINVAGVPLFKKNVIILNHQRRNSITEQEILSQKGLFSLTIFCFSHSIYCKKNGTSHPGQPTNLLCPFLVPQGSTYLPTQNRDVINGCSPMLLILILLLQH